MFAFTFWQLSQNFCEIQCPSKLILWCLASNFYKERCLLKANTEVSNNSPDCADYANLAPTFWRAGGESVTHCPSIPERWSWGQSSHTHYKLQGFVSYPVWPQLSISKNWHARLAFKDLSKVWLLINTHICLYKGDFSMSRGQDAEGAPCAGKHKGACTSQRVKDCLKTRTAIKLYLLSRQE